MENVTYLRNDKLHEVLRICLNTTENLLVQDEELTIIIRQIWTILSENQCVDTNNWLLHSRVAVAGLYYLNYKSRDKIFDTLCSLCTLDLKTKNLTLNEINIELTIEAQDIFKLSVLYGLLHLVVIQTELSNNNFKFFFDNIIIQCQQNTRHNNLYFQLLEVCVSHFKQFLNEYDCNYIFETIYYNLEKKNCCLVFKSILNKTDILQSSNILNSVLFSMSWKYKQKYILMNEILNSNYKLIASLPHEECVKGLLYAQSVSYLASVATRLYNTIVKYIDAEVWLAIYFAALENIITAQDTSVFLLKNIVKNYLNFEAIPHSYFEYIFEHIKSIQKLNIFIVLCMTVMANKKGFFGKDYNFESIVAMGWNNIDDYPRSLAFDIVCSVYSINSQETYRNIQNFIELNINDCGQSSRELIKKSYTRFLNKLRKKISTQKFNKEESVVRYSTEFFEWLIPFLFKQFSRFSNYQRISLSVILLDTTLKEFSKHITNKEHKEYLENVNVFKNLNIYLPKLAQILEVCDMEQSEKIIRIMLSEIDFSKISDEQINEIEELGFQYICNCNKDIAEYGQRLLEFVCRMESDKKQDRLVKIKQMMFHQWQTIKESRCKTIVQNNSLHPLISLISCIVQLYSSEDYESLLSFLEDVTYNLLNVFEMRAMIPFDFEGDYCIGIAYAFEDEQSEFHRCTVNCMWLVLKASCRLSTQLVEITKASNVICRVLNLLHSIIQKCYHKGALEEAGNALSNIVTSATKHNYCLSIMDEFLNQIFQTIPQATEATSTVRRAAETRLVLSTLAVSDKRLHKPYFHKTINFLIDKLDSCSLNPRKDSVHCLALHCLQPIILNNSVEIHIVEYLSTVAVISLKSFESNDWKVRNAALQTFGAVSNKLLGTVVSNETDQQHVICMEEVIFKHPTIFDYIIGRLCESLKFPQKRLNVIIPVLSFISMTYGRNDTLIESTKIKMKRLSDCLLDYLNIAPNFCLYMLAAKAYTAISYHENISNDIKEFGERIFETVNKNDYFSYMFLLKVLSDKLMDDANTLPTLNNVELKVLEQLDTILKNLSNRKTIYKVISGIHLFRPGLKLVNPEDMKNNLSYLIENPNLILRIPGIWECVENKLKLLFAFGNIDSTINLIKFCLEQPIPINIKINCLQFIAHRVQKEEQDKFFYSKNLTNLLIEIILDKNDTSLEYLTDEYVKLIILLDISHLDKSMIHKIIQKTDNITNNSYPKSYLPIFCSICQDKKHIKLGNYFEWCAQLYLSILKQEDFDILVIKSLKFTYNFAVSNKNDNIIVQILVAIYKMIQIDNDELKEEMSNILSYCFDLEPKNSYGNMMNLINSNNLIQRFGPQCSLKFLIRVYSERDDILQSINVFDKRQILVIETEIIEEQIFESISNILKELKLRNEYIDTWFSSYIENLPHKYHAQIIEKILKNSVISQQGC